MDFPDFSSYEEEKIFSAKMDKRLGLRVEEVERSLSAVPGQQIWNHVPTATMLTPYPELRRMLEVLAPRSGDLVVDLGAAYGRMGFVLHRYFSGVDFLGYELVKERVDEGKRVFAAHGLKGSLGVRDLSVSAPVRARFYFLYDYGTRAAIEKTLCDLREIASGGKISVVGRGRAVRDQIERCHPWLGSVNAPKHFGHFSVYES